MKDTRSKKSITLLVAIIILALGMLFNAYQAETEVPNSLGGKVEAIKKGESFHYALGEDQKTQETFILSVKLLEGPDKGSVVEADQYRDDIMPLQAKLAEVGDRVLIRYDESRATWDFIDYDRRLTLSIFLMVFFLLLGIFGGKKGLWTIVTLFLTLAFIVGVFLPGVLRGRNIYLLAIVTAIYIIFFTLILLDGWTKKSFASILGNVGGVLVAGLLAFIANKVLHLTGAVDENAIYLVMSLEGAAPLNLLGILWAGVIIGALGAIMDVSMTIASAVHEVALVGGDLSAKSLWKAGMAVGRDAMGTMTNTLILAYVGSYLSVSLLLMAHNSDWRWIVSMEMMVTEFVQGLVGSIGILITVPLTAAIAAILWKGPNKGWGDDDEN